MIAIVATIAASVAAGVALERRIGLRARRVAHGVLAVVVLGLLPPVNFFNIARFELTVDAGAGVGLAYLALGLTAASAWVIARRGLGLAAPRTGAVVLATVLTNTAYLGLPLTVALLGGNHLPEAIAYDVLVGGPALWVAGFAVGAGFGDRAGVGARQRTRSFFVRNPPLIAALLALLAPDYLAPDAAVEASRVAVLAILPLGFFAVGALLAGERGEARRESQPGEARRESQAGAPTRAAVTTALLLRLLLAPLLLLALAAPLIDLPASYLLLMAMPCGINALAVAHVYGLDVRTIAGAIAWGTAIVLVVGLVASALT